jgi:amino acid permease
VSDELFSRQEVLGGLPARRAQTLLFLLESRTAHLVARSREVLASYLTEQAERERDLAFVAAFSLGRDPPLRPTIQDLERHAPNWATLVPANPRLRAAVAHLLGQKYAFSARDAPGIRAALGLAETSVRQAYQQLYGRSLGTIYAQRSPLVDRLRWVTHGLGVRLESLPPFWTAYALTLTETVGSGVLALPIAVAGVGPLVAVGFLLALGLLSLLTIACMSEAVARSGVVRFGNAFHGRLVADYLGGVGSSVSTLVLGLRSLIGLAAYYCGVSLTLAGATGLPAALWVPPLVLIGIYLLSRRSLNATVASALTVGAINLGLLLVISLIAIAHSRPENLAYVNLPFLAGQSFEPSILQLLFGVILAAYFGHVALTNCAQVVLRRDPTARALIWGSLAALATAGLIYCLWVVAVNGVVEPTVLAAQKGTALTPLAAEVGPVVHLLGACYVLLGMGMASVHASFTLFNLVRERLPVQIRPVGSLAYRLDWRFWVGVTPVLLVCAVTEWLLLSDAASFSRPLAWNGVIAVSLLSGLFPVLLLASSRRKGQFEPGTVFTFLGHPLVVTAIYLIFLANIFLHGLVIWQTPAERIGAVLLGLTMVVATVAMLRHGALTRRLVVELRQDGHAGDGAHLAVTAGAQAPLATARLHYPAGDLLLPAGTGEVPSFSTLDRASIDLPSQGAGELKVWVHRVADDGQSVPLSALLDVDGSGGRRRFDLRQSGGQALLALDGGPCRVTITCLSAEP